MQTSVNSVCAAKSHPSEISTANLKPCSFSNKLPVFSQYSDMQKNFLLRNRTDIFVLFAQSHPNKIHTVQPAHTRAELFIQFLLHKAAGCMMIFYSPSAPAGTFPLFLRCRFKPSAQLFYCCRRPFSSSLLACERFHRLNRERHHAQQPKETKCNELLPLIPGYTFHSLHLF